MTPKEIEKRIEKLENRISPKELPSIWVCFGIDVPVRGWRFEEQLFLREPGETDEALRDRVLSLTEKYKNPPNCQVFISIV